MKFVAFIVSVAAIITFIMRANHNSSSENIASAILRIGNGTLNVDVADTDEERSLGLSKRDFLEEGNGMLFVFEEEGYHGIWMKEMIFPIDIVWLDKNKIVVHKEENVSPATFPKAFYPSQPSLYVLETSAHFLNDVNVKIGTPAEFCFGWLECLYNKSKLDNKLYSKAR